MNLIVEYVQDGSDRAEYGSHLLKNLEKQIDQKGMNYTLFKACRQFYKVYPQIGSTVSKEELLLRRFGAGVESSQGRFKALDFAFWQFQ